MTPGLADVPATGFIRTLHTRVPDTTATMTSSRKLAVQTAGVCLCAGLFAASVLLVDRVTLHSMTKLAWDRYGFSDILINYDAGFIRRGLLGAWVRRLSGSGSELPVTNTIVFANFLVLIVSITVMALRTGRQRIWNTILVLAIPGGMFAMAASHQFFYRKEIFSTSTLAVSALAISLLRQISSRGVRRFAAACMIALIFPLGVVLSLIHEGFLFLAAPANLFLLIAAVRAMDISSPTVTSARSLERGVAWAYAGLNLLVFLAMGYFRGGARSTVAIWNGLNPADRDMISPLKFTAIGWLSHSMRQLLGEPGAVLISGMTWFWLIPLVGLMLYCLALVVLNRDAKNNSDDHGRDFDRWIGCYLTLAACSLPIFFLGEDWGRWLSSINLSFLILWLSLPASSLPMPNLDRVKSIPATRVALQELKKMLHSYAAFVMRHRQAVVGAMLFFAITFRLPETFLEPSDPRYILYLGAHSVWTVLHRVTHLGP